MNNQIAGFFTNDIYSDRNNYGFIKLPNPRTGTDSVYLWNGAKKVLNEIQNFNRDHKTWIINENITKDSKFYVSNVIDPLFLAIPFLQQHAKYYTAIDTIMQSDEYPQFSSIMCAIFESNSKLEALSDSKNIDKNCVVYKYNNEKTMNWLKVKVDKLSSYFYQKKIVSDDSELAIPISFKDCTETDTDYSKRLTAETRSTAVEIVCDYISIEIEKVFKEFINFKDVLPEIKSPIVTKSMPIKSIEEVENYSPAKITKTRTATKPKISKESGLKSITNFFQKKN